MQAAMQAAELEATGGGRAGEPAPGRFFSGAPRLEATERAALLDRLGELDERLGRAGLGVRPCWRAQGAAAFGVGVGVGVGAGAGAVRGRWLDLSADLAEGADALAGAGLGPEALVMQAVADRLLAILLEEVPAARATPSDR